MRPAPQSVEDLILLCQGQPALPAPDLAAIYGISCPVLLERVHRHGPLPGELAFIAAAHEPPAFMRDGAQARPAWVFTEHGALAAAYLVGSRTALDRSIEVLRAFGRFRRLQGAAHAPENSWPASDAHHTGPPENPRRGDYPRDPLAFAG